MATYSLPGDNLPTERTEDDAPAIARDAEPKWEDYDEDGNPKNA